MPVAAQTLHTTHQYEIIRWTAETATGLPAGVGLFTDITVQATGTGTVTFEGSNDGTNYVALNDVSGNPLSLSASANALGVLKEHPVYIRPVVTGGTATVTALASGNR